MKTLVIVFVLFCVCNDVILSQTINNETCLPVGIGFSQEIGYSVNILGVNIGTVDYQYNVTGNQRDISIDWSTLRNKNPNMSESAIRDFIVNSLLRNYTDGDTSNPLDSTSINFYYKQDCFAEKICSFQLYSNGLEHCCESIHDTSFIGNKIYSTNDSTNPHLKHLRFIDVISKAKCGHKCCKDTYMCLNSPNEKRIRRVQGQEDGITLTNCPSDSAFHHCIIRPNNSGIESPCEEVGCHQWRNQ